MLILPQLLLTVSLKETVLLLVKVITFLGQVKILLPGSWHRCLWGCPRRWGWPTCCCWWSGCCSWWRKQNKLTLSQSHCWRRRESNRGKRERDGLRTRNLAGTATAEWWLMMCIFPTYSSLSLQHSKFTKWQSYYTINLGSMERDLFLEKLLGFNCAHSRGQWSGGNVICFLRILEEEVNYQGTNNVTCWNSVSCSWCGHVS